MASTSGELSGLDASIFSVIKNVIVFLVELHGALFLQKLLELAPRKAHIH